MNPSFTLCSLRILALFIVISIYPLVHTTSNTLLSLIEKNDILSVKKELASGINPNGCTPITPLMLAAEKGNNELVTLLLAYGADVHVKAGCGQSPIGNSALSFALKSMSLETIKPLIQAGAECNTWITHTINIPHSSITLEHPTLLMYIIEQLAYNKHNPMAEKKYSEIFDYFLTLEVDLNQKDKENQATPLILAVSHGLSNIVQKLLTKGASLPSTNKSLGISLQTLAHLSNNKQTELLIQEALSTTYYIRWLMIILIFCGCIILVAIKPTFLPKRR